MECKKITRGFTLVEMMIVSAIVALLMGFAWRFFFSGREIMQHTVTQSQVQSDTRILLDQLETEMASCYAFDEVDINQKRFSFYAFTYSKVALDDIFYDVAGNPRVGPSLRDAKIMVAKYEYQWREDGTVLKKRTPGWLYILQQPMAFVQGDANTFDAYPAFEKVVLRDIADFDFKAYKQEPDAASPNGTKITLITDTRANDATFIVLRIHTRIEEAGNRRDEELDIVTKFYSSVKLAEVANPGHFSSTDQDGTF